MEVRTPKTSVCALILGRSDRVATAVAEQERAPDTVVRQPAGLVGGLRAALRSGVDWVWILDGRSAPLPDALDRLLGALGRLSEGPTPAVLAGVVLGQDGNIDRPGAAWYLRAPTETAMAAIERRVLPIRAASAPVLVYRHAIKAEPPPRPRLKPGAGVLEWTARLLRARTGYWIPESESMVLDAASVPGRRPLEAAAVVLGGAFTGADRVRAATELFERAVARP